MEALQERIQQLPVIAGIPIYSLNKTLKECFTQHRHRIGPAILVFMLLTQLNFLILLLESVECYSRTDNVLPKQWLLATSLNISSFSDPWWAPVEALDPHATDKINSNHQNIYKDTLLIITCTLTDVRNLAALWSSLECMAPMYEQIHLALPDWSRNVMELFVEQVRLQLPQLHLTRHYVMLTRWDMGLWCDVLNILEGKLPKYIVLMNDSVFTMRPLTELLDALITNKYDMVGVTFFQFQDEYYVEQFMRGFTLDSIQLFINFTCVPIYDQSFGYHKLNPNNQRDHVRNSHEKRVHTLFDGNRIKALYQANPPEDYALAPGASRNKTWEAAVNFQYWMQLKDEYDFPFAKTNRPRHVSKSLRLLHLQACMTRVNVSWFTNLFKFYPDHVVVDTMVVTNSTAINKTLDRKADAGE